MELKVCRVCLERSASVSVFEWQQGVQYCTMIMKCAAVVVSEGDGLPDVICASCAAQLAVGYEFAMLCEASDRALRSLDAGVEDLIKQEIKPEHVSHNDSDNFDTSPHDYDTIGRDDSGDTTLTGEDSKISIEIEHNKKSSSNHMHRKSRLKTGPIPCPVCDKTLRCHSALEIHMRRHTKEKPYSCDICKKSYTTKNILKRHVMDHYGIKPERKPRNESDGRSNRPKTGPFQCSVCGRVAAGRAALDNHMRSHTGEKPFACAAAACGARYKLRGTLARHEAAAHPHLRPDARFVCEHCGKTFRARANIVTHLRVHSGHKPYACAHCGARFAQGASLARHARRHTGERPYACRRCGRAFADSTVLAKHAAVHSSERNHGCHLCHKAFKTSHALKIHINTHTGADTWVCSSCGISVASKGNLKVHIERMHSERSGICDVCHKHYGDVEAHMVVHTGAKPFECKICDRRYATRRSLSHHMGFKHRNAGKLKCTVDDCHQGFPTAPMLEFHVLKAHTAGAPHACPHCARAFRRRCDLSRHLRLHHAAADPFPQPPPPPPPPAPAHT